MSMDTQARADAEEAAAMTNAEAKAAEEAAWVHATAKSFAVASAAAAEETYLGAQAQAAAKHREASHMQLEELTVLSEAKLVVETCQRAVAIAVDTAGMVLAMEADINMSLRYTRQVADMQEMSDDSRAALDVVAEGLTRVEIESHQQSVRVAAAEVEEQEAAVSDKEKSLLANELGEKRSATVALAMSTILDAKAKADTLVHRIKAMSSGAVEKVAEDDITMLMMQMYDARDASAEVETALDAVAEVVPVEQEAKRQAAQSKVLCEVARVRKTALRGLHGAIQAEVRSRQSILKTAETSAEAATRALLAAMEPASRAKLESEVSQQMDTIVLDDSSEMSARGTYFNRIKALVIRNKAAEVQAKERSEALAAKVRQLTAVVAQKESNAAQAAIEANTQAEQAAKAAKKEAYARAELDAKQMQTSKLGSALSAAEAMVKTKEKEADAAEKSELMISAVTGSKKARITDAQKALQEARKEFMDISKARDEATKQVAKALAAYETAKEAADKEELVNKPLAQEKELDAKLELKAVQENLGIATRAAADAVEAASLAAREASVQAAEAQLRDEADSEAKKLVEAAHAAMAANSEAQKKSKLAVAKTKAEEEAAILAVKAEAKLKSGIV